MSIVFKELWWREYGDYVDALKRVEDAKIYLENCRKNLHEREIKWKFRRKEHSTIE